MATYRFGRLLLLAILVLCVGPLVIAAQANTYTETFDGPLNPALWTSFSSNGATVQVVDGELVVAIPTHASGVPSAGIQSTFNVGGIFSLEVEYRLANWTSSNGNEAGLYVKTGDTMRMTRVQAMNYHFGSGWGYDEAYGSIINGAPWQAATGDTTGKLLISRDSNSTVLTKYWNGSSWTQLGVRGNMYDDGIFTLSSWVVATGASEVHFDNFKVTSDNLPAVPLPPTALLLGCGLLGLGLPRLRKILRKA